MDKNNKISLICEGILLAEKAKNNSLLPEKFRREAESDLHIFLSILNDSYHQEVSSCRV